jgi:hypothetical protein
MGQLFNEALTSIIKNEINFTSDTIKVALYVDAPDIDADQYLSDLGTEASGAGYTAGGQTLGSKTVTTDDTNDRSVADAADVQWTGLTTSFRYIVVYKSTGVAGTSRLITTMDTGSTQTIDNGTYDITWPVSGVFFIQNP